MKILTLYRYEREKDCITVSTEKPTCDYIERYRLIADEGKAITMDNNNLFTVIDTDILEGWQEIEMPKDE